MLHPHIFKIMLMAAGCLLCAPAIPAKTVENPAIAATNASNVIDVRKVETGKDSTRLLIHASFRPKYWIQISPESYLSADGKDYRLTGAEGIEPGTHFWMPESGQAEFTLIFEPIPENTASIDLKEPGDDGWKLWGIDLTGNADNLSVHPDIPADIAKNDAPFFYQPIFQTGETTVNIHFLGYNPEMGSHAAYYINSFSGVDSDVQPLTIGADGMCPPLRFHQDGSAMLKVISIGSDVNVKSAAWIAPGDSLDLYIDCRASGNMLVNSREGSSAKMALPFADNGKYAAINRLASFYDSPDLHMQFYSGKFGSYGMSGDEYTDYAIAEYRKVLDNIAAKDMPAEAAEIFTNNAAAELLTAIARYKSILTYDYMQEHPDADYRAAADSITASLSPANYAAVAKLVDLDNPRLFMAEGMASIGSLANSCWEEAGVGSRQINDYMLYLEMAQKASEGKLSQQDADRLLAECSTPFYAESAGRINRVQLEKMAKLDADLITATPDVPADQVFDAIVAPHKGKVVMVDLWNTWCGPCRNALKIIEPQKSGELASDDIVWIYIANETSPLTKYLELLPGIKGTHYRVGSDEWESICDRFNVDGIPFYILVDHEGNATGRPDLRDHSKFKKALLEEAAKCGK